MKKVKNEKIKEANKKINKRASEFKEFITKGDVVDLAVGVIVGGAFGKIVTSLVNDILMPIIGVIIGGIDFTNLSVKIADAEIKYGSFIQQIVDFLIISLCVFEFVKIITRITKLADKEEKVEEAVKEAVEEVKEETELDVLKEIRELLKEKEDK